MSASGTTGQERDVTKPDELFRRRHDEDEWEEEPAEVRVRPSTTEVVSFRLGSDELDRVQEAARGRGISLSEFIRGAIERELDGGPAACVDDVYVGAMKTILGAEWSRDVSRSSVSWSLLLRSIEGRRPIPSMVHVVPDFPPTSLNITSSEGAEPLDDQEQLPFSA